MTGVSSLGANINQTDRLKTIQRSLLDIQKQIATGKKTDRFSGLGNDSITSQRARATLSSLETYKTNITVAQRRVELTINALTEFKEQANNVQDAIRGQVQKGEIELDVVKDIANSVYDYMFSLLNVQDGERYLLAGSDSGTQPVTDDGLMEAFVGDFVPDPANIANPPLVASGILGDWGAGIIDTDQFIASYRATNDVTLGYSAPLSSGESGSVFVRADENFEVDYTVKANSEGISDIMIALGVLRELPPIESAPGALNDPTATTLAEDVLPSPPQEKQDNFFQVFTDLGNLIEDAINKVDLELVSLSNKSALMSKIEFRHDTDILIQQQTLGDVEDVDINEAAMELNTLQFQLEASYTTTSVIQELSLTRYI